MLIHETFTELIQSAVCMLRDRKPKERALIVEICRLNDEERGAILFADRILKGDGEKDD